MVAWVAFAPHLGVSGPVNLTAGLAIAAATSHGRLSPDMDRYYGEGPRLAAQHRRLPHWFPVTLAAFDVAGLAGPYSWVVLAVAVAWASHVVTDAVFGKVPLYPRLVKGKRGRWVKVGLGLHTGGVAERLVAVPAMCAAGLLLVWAWV